MWIVDIDPVAYANIVSSVYTDSEARSVGIFNDFVLTGVPIYPVYVMDVNPPETALIVGEIDTYHASDINVIGQFAYIAAGSYDGLRIFDIRPWEDSYLVASMDIAAGARKLEIYDGIAYVASSYSGLRIIQLRDD